MMGKSSTEQRSADRMEFSHSFFMGNKALIIVVFLSIVLATFSPVFMKTSNLLNVLRQVCVSTLLSIGFTFILSSGHMDLSVGTLMGLSGMVLGLCLRSGLSLPVSIAACLLTAILGGALNASIITFFGLPPFVVTLATQAIFRGVNYLVSKLVPIVVMDDSLLFIGQGYLFGVPFPVYIMISVVAVAWIVMNKTRFGRHILAVGGNADAARVCGISVNHMRFYVYMTSGLCIGIAAIVMTGRVASAQVSAGVGMELDAIAAVVIGGTALSGGNANILGTMFGCIIVGIVNNGLNLLSINPNWQVIAEGTMILIAVTIDVLSRKSYAARLSKRASLAMKIEVDEMKTRPRIE
jgi:ribose transport system permease protein